MTFFLLHFLSLQLIFKNNKQAFPENVSFSYAYVALITLPIAFSMAYCELHMLVNLKVKSFSSIIVFLIMHLSPKDGACHEV